MKKIFFYIDSMQIGGANRVMANLTDYFAKESNDVILINDIEPQTGIPEYCISDNVKRLFLDINSKNKNVICKNINRIIFMRKLVKSENPDVIVSFMGPPNIRMLISTIGLKVKKIVSVRNDPYKEYGSGLCKLITRIVFNLADGCIFQTEQASEYFGKALRRRSKIIYNPVNPKFYNVTWEKKNDDIVVIGRLQEQKNPILALEAFSMVSKEIPNHRLIFYGDGKLKKDIIERSIQLGLQDRVIVHGKTNSVEKVLANAALYILSSDYEGMPNALMEAMAVGIPVISTDCPCGGPKTLIQNSDQGILVPVGDKVKMGEAIVEVLKNTILQKTLSENEKNRAKLFHPDIIYNEWETYLYE